MKSKVSEMWDPCRPAGMNNELDDTVQWLHSQFCQGNFTEGLCPPTQLLGQSKAQSKNG